jgi:hypothetical protein
MIWHNRCYQLFDPIFHVAKHMAHKSKPSMANEVLSYLSGHPEAQDTIEGIAEWWLLEQRIRHEITEVKKALDELVAQGLILERSGRDGHVHYRFNPRKRKTGAHYLSAMSSAPITASPATPIN